MLGDHLTIRGLHIYNNGGWNQAQDLLGCYGFLDELKETYGSRMHGEPLNQPATPGTTQWALAEGGSSSPGVLLSGQHINIEFTEIHDNGEDGIQDGQELYTPFEGPPHIADEEGFNYDWRQGSDVTIDHCWIYSSRMHSVIVNEPCGCAQHIDTFQYWTLRDAMRENIVITNSIFGPHGGTVMTGGGTGEIKSARTENTTFVGFQGSYGHAEAILSLISADESVTEPRFVEWKNNTFVAPIGGVARRAIQTAADNAHVNGCIIMGGVHLIYMDTEPAGSGNFYCGITNPSNKAGSLPEGFATEVAPQFRNPHIPYLGAMNHAGFDFTTQNPKLHGAGASITSVGKLYSILHPDWDANGNVVVEAPAPYVPEEDNSLNFLSVYGVTFDGPVVNGNKTDAAFKWNEHEYVVTVKQNTKSIKVSAYNNHPSAQVRINGVLIPQNQGFSPNAETRINPNYHEVPIANAIKIEVTAPNGSTREYTITINHTKE